MIQDPMGSRIQAVFGTGPTSETISIDKLGATSDGKGNVWRAVSSTTPGLRLDVTTSHDVTTAGRRRSLYRVDASYVDSSVSPAITYKASVYQVTDMVDLASSKDVIARNAAFATLINALVSSRTAAADFVASTHLTDFLNGEP
jgi:hypothetical protein